MRSKLVVFSFLTLLLAGCSLPVEITADEDGNQVIRIVTSDEEPTPTVTPTRPPPTPIPTPTPDQRPRHVIQSGDTMWGIATSYGVSLEELMSANNLFGPTRLVIGEELVIPVPTNTPTVTPTVTSTATLPPSQVTPTTPTSTPTATATATPDLRVLYEVQSGDSLWVIAAVNDITIEELRDANGMTPADPLRPGEILLIPVTPTATFTPTTRTPTPTPTATLRPTRTPTPVPFSTPPLNYPADTGQWPRYLGDLINERRFAHGLAPLTWSAQLAEAAQIRANDCRQQDGCDPRESTTSSIRRRLRAVGYEFAWFGENWVYAYYPEQALTWWYTEQTGRNAQRQHLLSPDFSEFGIGIAQDAWGMFYFVVDLGAPMENE